MSHPTRLRHEVGAAIVQRGLWEEADRVAVAVSGGIDSVCLLDLLLATVRWHKGVLSVVTVDHGTRSDAAADADFVEALAGARGVPCVRATLKLGPGASEAVMREARYAVFEDLDVDRVALAHHRGDMAETLLLHALRGTGTTGMAAMAWQRDRYVRPLLDVPKSRLQSWARARHLAFRDDPSNDDRRYLRNRLRHEVVPLLESLRPGAEAALARTAGHAAADDALLQSLADRAAPAGAADGVLPTAWVTSQPEPLVRRLLLRLAPSLTSAHIDDVLQAARRGAGRVVAQGGLIVEVSEDAVKVEKPRDSPE